MEELVYILTQQRNTALDALAQTGAQLLKVQRELEALKARAGEANAGIPRPADAPPIAPG